MVQTFARRARERIRIYGGGYRRDHLRALAQRVEVADREVRIIGSKSNLLQALTAASGVKPATPGVRSSVLKWRMGWDSNPRYAYTHGGFQDRCLQPLGHPSRRRRTVSAGGERNKKAGRGAGGRGWLGRTKACAMRGARSVVAGKGGYRCESR